MNYFSENTLHLPDNSNLMKGRFNNDYNKFVEKVIRKLHRDNINFTIVLIGEDFHSSIKETIQKLTRELNIEHKIIKARHLNTRASNIQPQNFRLKQTQKIYSKTKNYYCSYKRLNQGVLLPNGKVAICCNDYSLEHIVGDLKKDKLENIYTTIEKDDVLRYKFIEGEFLPCKNCEHYSPLDRDNTNSRTS